MLFFAIKSELIRYTSMKNILLLFSLLSTIILSAQQPKHEIGIEAGPNFLVGSIKSKSNVMPDTKEVYQGLQFAVGFLYKRNFNLRHSFRTGLTYEVLGQRIGAGTDSASTYRTNYISIPLLYQYRIMRKRTSVYANVGFSLMNYFIENRQLGSYHLELAFSTGLGVNYVLFPKVSIGLEARNNLWLNTFAGGYSSSVWRPDGNLIGTSFHYFRNHTTVFFSVAFSLGSKTVG